MPEGFGFMEIPTHLELLNPCLRALHELGGSASISELAEQVIVDLQPTDLLTREAGERS